jgi:hypothetical protein
MGKRWELLEFAGRRLGGGTSYGVPAQTVLNIDIEVCETYLAAVLLSKNSPNKVLDTYVIDYSDQLYQF